ncbi:uncharacterized protein METZ01_LOCUS35651 [marine metagenome]|uniref:Uncharacterized protein n=1 Tax=marine metagenome TaxID=408172 RepID=A0A381QYQ3_9ZZZZ
MGALPDAAMTSLLSTKTAPTGTSPLV